MLTTKNLSHDDAQRAIDVVRDELMKRNKTGVVAVSDAQGELIALLRLDGAPLPSITIATNKAFTAARERKRTMEVGKSFREKQYDIAFFGDSRYVGWGGGVPVVVNDQVVGAVAVSGLSQEEDEELALLGVKAVMRSEQ
jgi:glc operon protein GlcG